MADGEAGQRTRVQLPVMLSYGSDVDDEELDRISTELCTELLELDVDGVERAVAGTPPQGAKSSAAVIAATLVVSLSNSAGVVALIGVLRSWVGRNSERGVKIRIGQDTIDVTVVAPEEQARLVQAFIDVHAQQQRP